ncbi:MULTISPECIES: hypothetical protein [Bacillus]|uniref:hypothetical protein n=1 Tax=Bacillus TaxID=1386 RepID=UPI0004D8D58E|nr:MULTISPECIES: hypothetical protein [Bacillus]TFV11328.1 hypothetical protein E4T85_04240 [Bacillus stratosphericus]KEP29383.1 hypothetical protein ER50_12690 [Bacillus safensis]KLV22742.1 hypothetical protein ABW03_09050 [Bacillus altitudinis]KQU15337.1 hypothetical protein ASG46_00215 [Bacillus sp. Leaf49]MCS3483169.1 hypothetical protein [Bacillus sp. JUb11]
MSWLEFFSSILTSGSLATIIVVLILKQPITVILSRVGNLLSFKYKDILHLDFAKTLDEIEQNEDVKEDEQHESAPNKNSHNNAETNGLDVGYVKHYERLAKKSPEEAVYTAWLELEAELRYVVVRLSENNLRDIPEIVRDLLYKEHISQNMANNILGLWSLRNDIVKNPHAVFLDYKEAMRYCSSVIKLIKQLQKITGDYYMSGEKLSD